MDVNKKRDKCDLVNSKPLTKGRSFIHILHTHTGINASYTHRQILVDLLHHKLKAPPSFASVTTFLADAKARSQAAGDSAIAQMTTTKPSETGRPPTMSVQSLDPGVSNPKHNNLTTFICNIFRPHNQNLRRRTVMTPTMKMKNHHSPWMPTQMETLHPIIHVMTTLRLVN